MFTFEKKILGTETRILFRHPTFTSYGLALSVNKERTSVTCSIVIGTIDGESTLDIISDFAAPLEVMVWAFSTMLKIQNTVNDEGVDVENILTSEKIIYPEK